MLKNNIYILEKLLGNILLLRKNAGKTFTESCSNPGWLLGRVRVGGGCMRVGGTVKYLKRGWNRKEGGQKI